MIRKQINFISKVEFIVVLFLTIALAQEQTITTHCSAIPDTSVTYPLGSTRTFSVPLEAESLTNVYTIQLPLDSIGSALKPSRIIVLLDESPSMCGSTGNDNSDLRISSTKLLVDSLVSQSPLSEVAIIRYSGIMHFNENETYVNPLAVSDSANREKIKNMADSAACVKQINGAAKTTKRAETYPGSAVKKALELVDQNFDAIKDSLDRQIIIVTDGEWDDTSTNGAQAIISKYKADLPGRTLPRIHVLYITTSIDTPQIQPQLETITELTGGRYFAGILADAIGQSLAEILRNNSVVRSNNLKSVSVTNLKTAVSHPLSIGVLSNSNNRSVGTAPALFLDSGVNTIEVAMIVETRASLESPIVQELRFDTIVVTRAEGVVVDSSVVRIECSADTNIVSAKHSIRFKNSNVGIQYRNTKLLISNPFNRALTITLLRVDGRVVVSAREVVPEGKQAISMESFAPGIYIVKVKQSDGKFNLINFYHRK